MTIDTTFDFRSDANGKDPDVSSPTLRRYHQILWSKALPNGAPFILSDTTPGIYLYHRSDLGEFFLSSDSVIPTFIKWISMKPITEQFSVQENEAFVKVAYTMGGMMIFPSNRIDRYQTINGARGFTRAISDRFDLTLECIRRHYLNLDSPMSLTLARYSDFLRLFDDFQGYVDFFLLNDLVTDDGRVKFFMNFDEFRPPSVPFDVDSYSEYRRRSINFVQARNDRIAGLTTAAQPTTNGTSTAQIDSTE
jgi:hypothetical protein